MKSAPILIKLARHKIDAVQRKMRVLDDEIRACRHSVQDLQRQRAAEISAVSVDPYELRALSAFLKVSEHQEGQIQNQLIVLDRQKALLREELMAAFAQEKKIETLAEAAQAQKDQAIAAQEAAELDEMAVMRAK